MNGKFLISGLVAVVALSACGKSPEQKEADRQFKYQLTGQKIVKKFLKDPGSAQFRNNAPNKFCGEVNSKNSLGGMTGFKRYVAYDLNAAFIDGENIGESDFNKVWNQLCLKKQ